MAKRSRFLALGQAGWRQAEVAALGGRACPASAREIVGRMGAASGASVEMGSAGEARFQLGRICAFGERARGGGEP